MQLVGTNLYALLKFFDSDIGPVHDGDFALIHGVEGMPRIEEVPYDKSEQGDSDDYHEQTCFTSDFV